MADAARTSADGPFAHPPPAFDPNDPSSRDQHSGSPVQGSAVDNVTGSVDNAPNGQAATDQDGLSQSQNLPGLSAAHSADPDTLANVATVLSSEIGIATLLNRLKQSIASAREFALFLKKRAALEEDNCSGLKKLCRLTQDSMRRPEHRTGTFSQAYDEMVYIHERMAENGSHFAASLHQMHDDLVELASTAERSRKHWKTNGLSAEQKVADLEQAMRKQKTKYDALADEYERARTGEARQTGKVLNAFKNKSAAQQEEDLLRKVQAADASYQNHVQTVLQEKQVLESTTRPEAIQSLQDLIKELDSGLALQMQKFAAFNEKLLLSNGLSISPIKGPGGGGNPSARSLRHAVMSIDNERDLTSYVSSQLHRVPPHQGEIKYERNPVLNGPGHSSHSHAPPLQTSQLPSQPPPGQGPQSAISSPFTPAGQDPRSFAQAHNRTFSSGNIQPPSSAGGYQPPPGQPTSPYGAGSPPGPPQLGALSFQPGPPPPGGHMPSHDRQISGVVGNHPGAAGSPPPQAASAPVKPVFGVPLARLYERDGLAVPLVVYQCIQAVDLFGLGVEGIYRQSGSMSHIQKLKHMFDTDTESQNKALDFRNPENFYHDVNSVTGLLKQFFRDLPDPLLTAEHHDSLVAAAKHDDDILRRDSLHAIINSLPDPNYATLRALSLHLYRVMDNAHVNRMNSHNLSLILGPTLMGTPSSAISDGGWQIKVIDTILQNTYQIFDED